MLNESMVVTPQKRSRIHSGTCSKSRGGLLKGTVVSISIQDEAFYCVKIKGINGTLSQGEPREGGRMDDSAVETAARGALRDATFLMGSVCVIPEGC